MPAAAAERGTTCADRALSRAAPTPFLSQITLVCAAAASASAYSAAPRSNVRSSRVAPRAVSIEMGTKAFVVGVAADSGCGKSTFMRRLTGIFGGKSALLDIGRETNTLVSDKVRRQTRRSSRAAVASPVTV